MSVKISTSSFNDAGLRKLQYVTKLQHATRFH